MIFRRLFAVALALLDVPRPPAGIDLLEPKCSVGGCGLY